MGGVGRRDTASPIAEAVQQPALHSRGEECDSTPESADGGGAASRVLGQLPGVPAFPALGTGPAGAVVAAGTSSSEAAAAAVAACAARAERGRRQRQRTPVKLKEVDEMGWRPWRRADHETSSSTWKAASR